jgi:hypothetical protein
MTCALGVKAPTDYSVWTAAAAAFLLGVVALRKHGAESTRKFDAEARKPEQYSQARVTQEGGQLMENHRDRDPAGLSENRP